MARYYYCLADLCHELSLQQCDYCGWYEAGYQRPHFPMPAIPLEVWHGRYHVMIINPIQRTA